MIPSLNTESQAGRQWLVFLQSLVLNPQPTELLSSTFLSPSFPVTPTFPPTLSRCLLHQSFLPVQSYWSCLFTPPPHLPPSSANPLGRPLVLFFCIQSSFPPSPPPGSRTLSPQLGRVAVARDREGKKTLTRG